MDWLAWLVAAGVFAVAEVFTLTFVLAMIAGGAVAGSVVAGLGGPIWLQFLVAALVSCALLVGVRPIAKRHLAVGGGTTTGAEALVGMEAVVLSQVDQHGGRVRLNGGEWSARAFERDKSIQAGRVVRVMAIEGATAVVLDEA